jgi:hypothetical protein
MSAQQVKQKKPVLLEPLLSIDLGQKLGQLRAFPVRMGAGKENAICAVYGADFDDDPSQDMFFLPTDTLKIILFTPRGEVLWKRDLGRGVIPGIWFCPVYPFDLNGDGVDEIWFVNNLNTDHPFSIKSYRLERIDALTGETIGQYPWPTTRSYAGKHSLTVVFRHFIMGGYVHGEPVLVTSQGKGAGNLCVQGWNADMTMRWETVVTPETPGARASHVSPVVDINQDGVDELFWGERCLELDGGKEIFCADRDTYNGHSDVIQPVLDRSTGRWSIYTCREGDRSATPRVVMFDEAGNRLWGAVDEGHMDIGWVARIGEERKHIGMSVRIGAKSCGPEGRFHAGMDEFTFDIATGQPYPLDFSIYRTIPVDVNGDGYHELVRGMPAGDGELLDRNGRSIGSVGGTVAMASKFLDLPGEQILSFRSDGIVQIWADRNARDSEFASERYANPYYEACQRLYGVGYNLYIITGL